MRILLVEDEPDLGLAIKWALKQEKYVVDWAQTGPEGWEYLDNPTSHYVVAILDWLLPGMLGIELCQRLRQRQNPLPVLMLTARDRLADKVAGLDAGADDYLIKPFDMEELLARVRALQRRSPHHPVQQVRIGNLLLDYTSRLVFYQAEASENPQPIVLTNKEFQLLEYFMSHPHHLVSSEQLLAQLWEMETEVASNVVAAQMRLLRRKLAQYGYADLIETVPSMGYRINPTYVQ
ncbi:MULTISPECIES: two-component system response regulator RppA [unclassified Leptolyngbya]|uniref:two-component system response regulator RppA n=1 Tax=unclassified Leptolyngbya TaxID=2650499 RepID=UPI001688F527|nr:MULTISPECIES: two-component system response regulator RppA [unclassified Leptolyngbya]MBD1911573.1 response regulator transcription factor [Leptolyngbya sp. FACHB-8]MBD2155607.1 response regulator transcription factor [Leptolyngbya sp. FACHB-16]